MSSREEIEAELLRDGSSDEEQTPKNQGHQPPNLEDTLLETPNVLKNIASIDTPDAVVLVIQHEEMQVKFFRNIF